MTPPHQTHRTKSKWNSRKAGGSLRRNLFLEFLEDRNLMAVIPGVNYSTGTQLTTYTLALATTAEFTQSAGGTAATAALLNQYVTELNGVFGRELALQFQLHPENNKLIFTDAVTDGYTNGSAATMLGENTAITNRVLNGDVNNSNGYDLGHVLGIGNDGGVAGPGAKGGGASDVATASIALSLVAHEIGHQFAASHNMNGLLSNCAQRANTDAFEPGSGSSLMSYGGLCDTDNLTSVAESLYFSANNFDQMLRFITQDAADRGARTATNNALPTINAGPDRTIPANTPFTLTSTANDTDAADQLTFAWEQIDNGAGATHVLQSSALTVGGNPATLANTLNQLDQTTAQFVDGDRLKITSTAFDGTAGDRTYTFRAGDTLANLLSNKFGDPTSIPLAILDAGFFIAASGALSPQGRVLISARNAGASTMSLTVAADPTDPTPNSGVTNFGAFTTIVAGRADPGGVSLPIPNARDNAGPLFRSFAPSTSLSRTFPQIADILANTPQATNKDEHLPTQSREMNFRVTARDNHLFNGRTISGIVSDDVKVNVVNTGAPFRVTSHNAAATINGGSRQTITWDVAGTTANGINTSQVDLLLSSDGGFTYPIQLAIGTANDGSEEVVIPNVNIAMARIRVQADATQNTFFDVNDANLVVAQDLTVTGGIVVTESNGNTRLAEGRFAQTGLATTDTYTIALTQPPAGPVDIAITTNPTAQVEVSLDGVGFAATQSLRFNAGDNTAKTITVRSLDDAIAEGAHTTVLRHAVTLSADPNYSPLVLNAQTVAAVNAVISDDEAPPVVGVDFNFGTLPFPANWTNKISGADFFTPNLNLLRETGDNTAFDLTLTVPGFGASTATPSATTIPRHTPNLSALDTVFTFDSLGAEWKDLRPNTKYRVYAFVIPIAGQTINQKVTITGSGAPTVITQDGTGRNNQLLVNGSVGSSSADLETVGLVVTADGTGKINLLMEPNVGGGKVSVTALAIQEFFDAAPGFKFAETGGKTETTEAATTDTVTIVLETQPATDVVLTVSSGNTGEAIVAPATLTFTNANWDLPQTVTVTGVDDPVVDGDKVFNVTVAVQAGSDAAYAALAAKTVSVTNKDNDVAAFTMAESGGKTETSEAGTTDTITVVLAAQPTTDVVFTVVSARTSEATVAPASLTFTNANWNVAQTVTVTGVDDALADGPQTFNVTVAVQAGSNAAFANLAAKTVSVTNLDNDQPGVTIAESGGTTVTTEAGTTDSFTVVLDAQPATNVVLTVTSTNTAEAVAAPATLTFTNANWNVAQTVTMTGVDDPVIDGNKTFNVTVAVQAGSDAAFANVAAKNVSVTNQDNDVAAFNITETGGKTETSEAGTTDIFTVVLAAQPLTNVVLTVVSARTTEATAGPTTLTFTTASWNVAQTVTVTGVDDPIADGDQSFNVTVAVQAGSDAAFAILTAKSVSVSNQDNDQAGITIVESGGKTETTEAGTADTFTVVLNTQPTTNVVLSVASGNTGEATAAPTTLTFTNANWNIAQTVTVTGVDDPVVDGDKTLNVTVTVQAGSDASYAALAAKNIGMTNKDNDVAAFTLAETGGKTETSEAGTTDTFTIVLAAQPTTDVVFTVVSARTSEATVAPATLTFTNANWNIAQTVTVTGVDDAAADGDQTFNVTVAVQAGSNAAFANLAAKTGSVINRDNDQAGMTIAQTGGGTEVTEAGTTDTLMVVLNTQPATNVVLTVVSGNLAEVTAAPATLTFTNANWNIAQTVTATGVDDTKVDGDVITNVTITVNAAQSDAAYGAVVAQTVGVTTKDNDVAGFSVTETGGITEVNETGTTDTVNVVLTAEPIANVVFSVTSSRTIEATVDKAALTFTPANWNVAQVVTIKGVQDNVVDGNQTITVQVAVNAANSQAAFAGLAAKTTNVTVIDSALTNPWQFAPNRHDVNGDGFVVPLDVLLVINELNDPKNIDASGKLPAQRPATEPFLDVSGDGFCTALDALQVINFLNGLGNPEGEFAAFARALDALLNDHDDDGLWR